jgi:NosR/NirI family transcriptional regulator, nitrous oxide reductase regulator
LKLRIFFALFAGLLIVGTGIDAFSIERFPPPQFEGDYVRPVHTAPMPRGGAWPLVDAIVLIFALGVSSFLALKQRSRAAIFSLMVFSIAYFGFYRKGCVCSIGAIQDMSIFLFSADYTVPLLTIFFFVAPLVATLLFGRSFCAGVCPLGAVQDLTLIRPVKVPAWLEHALRYFAYVYLSLAVWMAVSGSTFVICKYDPYVAIFRRNANLNMLILGGILLVIGFFIGRPYCRFLCPYGVILRQLSRLARWRVKITPTDCNQCRLCEDACPYGAIQAPVPEWPEATYKSDKTRLAWFLVLLPLLVLLGAWIGNGLAPFVARTHPAIALAERIWTEENRDLEDTTDASDVFRASGETIASLYKQAGVVRTRFEKGGWFFGGFLGLILGGKLILLTIRPRQRDYEAERAGCFSCGRCFKYCPKEQEYRLRKVQEIGGMKSK